MSFSTRTPQPLFERGFTTAEYEARTAEVQACMAVDGIDLLLFTTEPEVRYYSGFFTQFWQSPTRPWFLLVPSTGRPVAVIPAIGEACMRRTWLQDIRCWSSPHPSDDGVSLLADTILELAGNGACIGMLKGRESSLRMALNDFESLQSRLPRHQIADVTPMVQGLRQIKSDAEIAKIAAACQAAGKAFEELPSLVKRGDTEREIFRQFKLACLNNGVDDVSYLVGAAGANGYEDIISPPSDQQTHNGDVLILDTGCIVDGYFCDFDRNYVFGKPDAATVEAYSVTHEALEAALAAVRPGVSCSELFKVMQSVLGTGGDSSVGRFGHGLGMQLTESPSITPFDQTLLQADMVMTLEPGISYGNGKVMVHEENIVVTAEGARLLTNRAAAEIMVI